jgi:hypothetical protein
MDRAWMGWFWVKRYGYLPPAVWAGGSLREGRGWGSYGGTNQRPGQSLLEPV